MDKQDVIQAAGQMELDGRDFYLKAAKEATNDVVANIFKHLADDEVKHLEWINKNLGPHDANKQARKDAYDRLTHIFKDVPEDVKKAGLATEGDIEPLRYALDFEKKAVLAYSKWADETDDVEVKEMCKILSGVEQFHVELLDNTILYLESPDEYFQKEEGWMLDGA